MRHLSDFKQEGRIRDGDLLRDLHLEWRECAICLEYRRRLSLHHVLKHPRDDVRPNLVMLCGDGTTGCHGLVESNDPYVLRLLAEHIRDYRPDVVTHLEWRLGPEGAREWMRKRLGLDS